jgi:hypothetical protein
MADCYIYYYHAPRAEFSLNCGCLAQDIVDRWRGFCDGGRAPAGPPDKDAAAYEDDRLWAAAARLRWMMRSDRIIDAEEVAGLLAVLAAEGELNRARLAVRQLASALISRVPLLATSDWPSVVQLVALGRGLATAAGESPEFLEFVKKEFQAVDLADVLQVGPET